ncbi:MAG TPA: ATP-dependent RNA helicase HrpA, partial [Candidatus Latescibacteria bacterium]|nr:ATP-dependent RNA helicase HrpA [Candidatus Latescibacterota bacterium]
GSSDLIADIDTLLPRCMIRDRIVIERQLKAGRRGRKPDRRMLQRLKDRAETSALLLEHRRAHRPEVSYPDELPLTARKDEILEAIRAHPVVIVAGETGSGKTTQLPKICLEAGRGLQARIACTQPRRVAALSVSRRIAEELDVTWG